MSFLSLNIRQNTFNRTFIWIVFLLAHYITFAQSTSNEQIQNRQRSILIYNFAQQIGWDNINEIQTFTIGVLGRDPLIKELEKIAAQRRIHGKTIKVKELSSLKDIRNISLLYVHERFNYDIQDVLKRVSKKNILVISENYYFNTSMINMIHTGESFQYEMNRGRMQRENFTIGQDLIKNAIDSKKKWQDLYKISEKSLASEREIVVKQKEVLEEQKVITQKQSRTIVAQKELLIEQFEKIDTKETRLEKLEMIRDEQQKRFRQKLSLLDSLENFIKKQEDHIQLQEDAITLQKNDIAEQSAFIQEQLTQIDDQKKILQAQKSEINTKSKQTLLVSIIACIALLAGFFVYRSARARRRLNHILLEKNNAIKQKTEELETQNQEMEQFAYIASHDLQEPLNTINSFINLLSEEYKETFDDVGKQSLDFIADASARMKILVTSLLEYSRLGRDKVFDKVACNKILINIQNDLSELISSTDSNLTVASLPTVIGNPTEIRLLFQNLISNAIKFIPNDRTPTIHISCEKIIASNGSTVSKSYWKFNVVDNGIGIAPKHREKIFAIFQRLHSKETYKGTGIGLAHCKKIVESHGGTIGVDSKEGQGSTFWFTIPCETISTNMQ